jgi:glutathione S-transferase
MKLELIYPNFPFWRAEVSRLALFIGDIPFANVHPSREEFAEMKECGVLTFGQVPVLKVDGKVIAQTGAIARFCGKLSGLYPTEDHFVAAKVDEVIDAATDISNLMSPTMREKDPETKIALRKSLAEGALPQWLGYLERYLEVNGSSGFFVTARLTIADLAIWRLLGWLSGGILDGIPKDIIAPFPLLKKHFDMVGNIPKVQQWMSKQYGK